MALSLKERLFRAWYWYVSRVDKKGEVVFMNYGYCNGTKTADLDEHHEPNRYSVQLYHHLAEQVEISNKDIVEVGSGRGGGLSYVVKRFKPTTAIGVDMNPLAIKFCNGNHSHKGLSFQQGDAQMLTLPSDSCDVVLNVESSHRYPNFKSFLGEVKRILRPNGHFLFTDFRYQQDFESMQNDIESLGLTIVSKRIITKEVIAALQKDDSRRRMLVKKLTPKILHSVALNFAGTVGSETYNHFDSGKYIYCSYVLKKE